MPFYLALFKVGRLIEFHDYIEMNFILVERFCFFRSDFTKIFWTIQQAKIVEAKMKAIER